MSPERKRAFLHVGAPLVVCAGVAGLLGGLLRPAERSPEAPAPTERAAPAEAAAPASARPRGNAHPNAILVQAPLPANGNVEPLPPLPPGTTTQDLLDTYAEEVCACPDKACVDAAVSRRNRYFGQAVRVRNADNRAVYERISECLAAIDEDEKGG